MGGLESQCSGVFLKYERVQGLLGNLVGEWDEGVRVSRGESFFSPASVCLFRSVQGSGVRLEKCCCSFFWWVRGSSVGLLTPTPCLQIATW